LNWNQQDNKQYRGKIDRIFVSATESYEAHYFVDEYLKKRGFAITDANRRIIHKWFDAYPGRAPVLRTDLYNWMDAHVTAKA
jgi:hypothetical protein